MFILISGEKSGVWEHNTVCIQVPGGVWTLHSELCDSRVEPLVNHHLGREVRSGEQNNQVWDGITSVVSHIVFTLHSISWFLIRMTASLVVYTLVYYYHHYYDEVANSWLTDVWDVIFQVLLGICFHLNQKGIKSLIISSTGSTTATIL